MPIRDEDTNQPDVMAELRDAFDAYEAALVANDVPTMDGWFWDDPRTVRYGTAENLYGHDEIARWRASAAPVPATREITQLVITTFADDCAVIDCEFTNNEGRRRGRQSQTWVRFEDGWKIVAAHVSMIGGGPAPVGTMPP